MLLLNVRGKGIPPIIKDITDLILNARKEMLAARKIGNHELEDFWSDAMDRFLDTYARETSDPS